MSFDVENSIPPGARIKVFGIGGGGGNAINTMIRGNLEGVDFIAANTDLQALRSSLAPIKIQVGKELTKGLGAGADPDIGRDAALEDRHAIQEALAGADMVFIAAGMGGGTGTGGASVVAQIARELGALTVAVVTKPFDFEGRRRKKHADLGVTRLRETVDTLITIPNQRLLQVASPELSMIDAFKMADNVLVNAVRGISDIINIPGTVNVDFADVKTVMSSMGMALMGIGVSEGPNRAVEAARQAISSPLLEDVDIEGATGILINITAGSGITLMEVNEACSIIQEAAHEDANIIFGAVIDEKIGQVIRVTVIATGFPVEGDETDSYPAPRAQSGSALSRSLTSGLRTPGVPAYRQSPVQSPSSPASFRAAVEEDTRRRATEKHFAPEHKAPSRESVAPQPSQPSYEERMASQPPQSSMNDARSMTPTREAHDLASLTLGGAPALQRALSKDEASDNQMGGEFGISFNSGVSEDGTVIEETTFTSSRFESAQESAQARAGASTGGREEWSEDIDRKIDEALLLVERLRGPTQGRAAEADDDLDVPTFLRQGVKGIQMP